MRLGRKYLLVLISVIAAGNCCPANVTGTARTYSVSCLPAPPKPYSAVALFVDSDGCVVGRLDRGMSSTICLWRSRRKRPERLRLPGDVVDSVVWMNRPFRMNDLDQVVYRTLYSSGIVDLRHERVVRLAGPPGTLECDASDINDHGVCAGTRLMIGGGEVPAVWFPQGQMTQMRLPAGCSYGCASAINNSGAVLGVAYGNYGADNRLVVWSADGSVLREILFSAEDAAKGVLGIAISDNGYLLIQVGEFFERVSPSGVATTLAWGLDEQGVEAMNSSGQVLGYDRDGPLIWNTDGSTTRLPSPYRDSYCTAHDLGDNGVVVGEAENPVDCWTVPVIWTPKR